MGFSLTMLQAGWEVFSLIFTELVSFVLCYCKLRSGTGWTHGAEAKLGIEWKTRIAESWNIQSWRGPTRIIGSFLCHIWLDLVLFVTCSLKTILKTAATGVCWDLLPNPTKGRWLEKQHVCRCGMWRTHEDNFWSSYKSYPCLDAAGEPTKRLLRELSELTCLFCLSRSLCRWIGIYCWYISS